ncbi:filamentous hemagglutinin N-terminal domain-containing protein [Campylobacter coli]|nr:filamentous hemagglutinin N-terminal domain-containing protein [Campylobacter coli]
MKKNRIILSLVAAAFLCSESLALPSGGKFTHGTSGNIATNGNNMQVNGNGQNSVIQWGGGFSIGKGESVNFGGSGKNYLNISYGKDKSTIAGLLNGGANNVFLINPKGVIITKDGTINANKFVASTTPIKDSGMQAFATSGNYSPIFDSSTTRADIVNLGTINANEIALAGNKVENLSGTIQGVNGKIEELTNQKYSNVIEIKGNNVYLDGDKLTGKNINVEVAKGGSFTQHTTDYRNKHNTTNGFEYNFSGAGLNNFQRIGYISNKNDWLNFSNNWNEGIGQFNYIFNEFRLTKNIDMQNTLVNPVGNGTNSFSANFHGNGYTLSNLLINADGKTYAGLFGYIEYGSVQGLTIDGLNFKYGTTKPQYIGGFAGYIDDNTILSNIALNNIGNISSSSSSSYSYAGGFAGEIDNATLSNIVLNNIGNISSSGGGAYGNYAGGFVGWIRNNTTFSNIVLNNIENISGSNTGGFVGTIWNNATLSNIVLNNIGNISSSSNAGGFAGEMDNATLSNIVLNNIGDISSSNSSNSSSNAGGFVGIIYSSTTLSNIVLNNIGNISSSGVSSSGVSSSSNAGGFVGTIWNNATLSNIVLNNIGNISSSGGGAYGNYAGGFIGYDFPPTSATNIYFYGAMNLSGNNTNKDRINSHKTTALNLTNTANLQTIQNHMQNGSTLKNLEYVAGTNGNSYLHMVTNGNVGGADSKITFNNSEKLYELKNTGEVADIEKPTNAGEVADIEVSDDMWDKTTIQNIINELIDSKYEIVLTDLDKIKVNGQEYLLSDLSETDNPFYQSFAFLQAFTDNTQGALNDLLAKYANDKDFKHYQEANNYVKNGADNFNAKIQQLKNEKVEEQLNQIKDNILALESIFSKWNIKITDLIANYNSLINAFIADKNLYNEKRNEFEKLIATEGFDRLEAEKLKQELLAMDKKLVSDYEILSSKKSEIENNIKLANAELDLDTIFSSLNTINDKIEGIIGGNINTELAFNINKPNGDKAHGSIKYSDDNILANANLDLNEIKDDSDKWNSGGNIDKPENPELPPIDNGDNSKPENPELPSDDNGDNEFKLPETPADSADGILFNDKKKKEDEDPLFKRHQEDEKVKMCLSSSSSLVNNICLR